MSLLCISSPFPLGTAEQLLAAEGEGKALSSFQLPCSALLWLCLHLLWYFFTFGLIYFNSSWGDKWIEDLHPKPPSLYCLVDWLASFF